MYKMLVIGLFTACLVNAASLVGHISAWPTGKRPVIASVSEAIQSQPPLLIASSP